MDHFLKDGLEVGLWLGAMAAFGIVCAMIAAGTAYGLGVLKGREEAAREHEKTCIPARDCFAGRSIVDPRAPTKQYPFDRRHLFAFPDTLLDMSPVRPRNAGGGTS